MKSSPIKYPKLSLCQLSSKSVDIWYMKSKMNKNKRIWYQLTNLSRLAVANSPKVVFCTCWCASYCVNDTRALIGICLLVTSHLGQIWDPWHIYLVSRYISFLLFIYGEMHIWSDCVLGIFDKEKKAKTFSAYVLLKWLVSYSAQWWPRQSQLIWCMRTKVCTS